MQLVAYGAQDVYLTGSPQITFFKMVYRRHTNFAVESIEQVFNGTADFGKKASVTISRNGDLVTNCILEIIVPSLESLQPALGGGGERTGWVRYVNSFAHAFVESCEIDIGGQRIDKHYSEYFEVMTELTCPESKRVGYGKMTGKHGVDDEAVPYDEVDEFKLDSHMGCAGSVTYYVPLRFWFNKSPGLALPLISLQYHEVKIQFVFQHFEKLINWKVGSGEMNASGDKPGLTGFLDSATVSLYVDYVYLDTDERRRFAQASHEYLIEQLQYTGAETYTLQPNTITNEKVRLTFNHPVKELLIFTQTASSLSANKHFDFGENMWQVDGNGAPTFKGRDLVTHSKLLLNGHERFSERPGSYFRLVVPFQVHTRIPNRHIYCYSFSLTPEEHQPSGSCNFSRIDNASLHLTLAEPLPRVVVDTSKPFTDGQSIYTDLRLQNEALVFVDYVDPACFVTPGITNMSFGDSISGADVGNVVIKDLSPNRYNIDPTGFTSFSKAIPTDMIEVTSVPGPDGMQLNNVSVTNPSSWRGTMYIKVKRTVNDPYNTLVFIALGNHTTATVGGNNMIGIGMFEGNICAYTRKSATDLYMEPKSNYTVMTSMAGIFLTFEDGIASFWMMGPTPFFTVTIGNIDLGTDVNLYVGGVPGHVTNTHENFLLENFAVWEDKILTYSEMQSLQHSIIDFETRSVSDISNGYNRYWNSEEFMGISEAEALAMIANSGITFTYNAPTVVVHNSTQIMLHVYAISYNILRIMSGMGGLAYSN